MCADPLSPSERARADQAAEQLIEDGKAFRCGLCGSLVDVRFTEIHADWHDRAAG